MRHHGLGVAVGSAVQGVWVGFAHRRVRLHRSLGFALGRGPQQVIEVGPERVGPGVPAADLHRVHPQLDCFEERVGKARDGAQSSVPGRRVALFVHHAHAHGQLHLAREQTPTLRSLFYAKGELVVVGGARRRRGQRGRLFPRRLNLHRVEELILWHGDVAGVGLGVRGVVSRRPGRQQAGHVAGSFGYRLHLP